MAETNGRHADRRTKLFLNVSSTTLCTFTDIYNEKERLQLIEAFYLNCDSITEHVEIKVPLWKYSLVDCCKTMATKT